MDEDKKEVPGDSRFGPIHARRQAERKVRVIAMPEWGEKKKPLLLYAYPLTINDVVALDSAAYLSTAEQNVMQIIRQCMDEKGDQYFSLRDKVSLLNEPADVIGRLLVELNGATDTFDKVLKKNKV